MNVKARNQGGYLQSLRVTGLFAAAGVATWGVARSHVLDSVHVRWLAAALIGLAYLVFCLTTYLKHKRTQQAQEALWVDKHQVVSGDGAPAPEMLVAFASQTGFAEQLAMQTAQSLRQGGMAVRVLPLARLTQEELATTSRALLILSTTGEGDAPDNAAGFARRMAQTSGLDFSGLQFGVLALGDRSYAQYCAFGHTVSAWLRRHHAQPLFDLIEVDNGDEGALRHWQHHLGVLSGHTDLADWTAPTYGRWRLVERRLLNPGSAGGPAYHLSLTPLDLPVPDWQAGDIAEIGPRNAQHAVAQCMAALGLSGPAMAAELAQRRLPQAQNDLAALRRLSSGKLLERLERLPHREYSIASLPDDGALDLLVRQMATPDGGLGIGSGWLTRHVDEGSEIALRIRRNSSFHGPNDDRPLILIGNGTGLAGLRAHLRARALAGHRRNWLVFGERSQATDYFHRTEIESWLEEGTLARLDLAFSRDQVERVYVQDKLRAAGDVLRQWVDDGASIYVCGSLQGMAVGVAAVLEETLGDAQLVALTEEGRYRRDVY